MDAQPPLAAGFADPVLESQATFRVLLDAMARPARPLALAGLESPPSPLFATTAALALTLLDPDTRLWLDPPLAEDPALRAWLAFHSAAPLVTKPEHAIFALVADPLAMPALNSFALGDERYPDRSTTLILQVETFESAGARLSGPGFAEAITFGAKPLPEDFWEQLKANAACFPRGVDLVLASRDAIAGLPRSTQQATCQEAN